LLNVFLNTLASHNLAERTTYNVVTRCPGQIIKGLRPCYWLVATRYFMVDDLDLA